jgi:hypothetical protein
MVTGAVAINRYWGLLDEPSVRKNKACCTRALFG